MSVKSVVRQQPIETAASLEVDQAFLKSPVILCAGDAFQQLRKIIPTSVAVWRLLDVDATSLKIEVADRQIRSLRYPPLITIAVVATNAGTASLATDAATWLRAHGSRTVPEPIVLASKSVAAFAAELIGQLVKLMSTQAEFITTYARELASLRSTNENLQNHFSAVEGVLARKGFQPYDLDFVSEPVDSRSTVLNDSKERRVAQVLPVGSTGISAVGVHIADIPPSAKGSLQAQIASLEDGAVLGTWTVAISALRAGWNVFGFDRSLSGLPRTLEITIAGVGDHAELPRLSLGAAQPIERFRVQDANTGKPLAHAGLAIQVWTGLAAVALPDWATYWSSRPTAANRASPSLLQHPIPPDRLALVTLDNVDEVKFDFTAVQVLDAERAVSCHPPAFGMTVARLPGACPAGALRVSANARLANEKSRDVEFALAIAVDGARARALLSGDIAPEPGESVSDWTIVQPMGRKAINAFIASPVAESRDIFVATRMVQAGNHDFAWAKFTDLTAVFQDMA